MDSIIIDHFKVFFCGYFKGNANEEIVIPLLESPPGILATEMTKTVVKIISSDIHVYMYQLS